MADSSLDDFFAKKDKSKKGKKKDKSKFTPSDIIAKQAEEPKKEKKRVKEKTTENKDENPEKTKVVDGVAVEEWNDYEDTDADYSGLRIQTLQISSKEEKEEVGEKVEGEDEEDQGEGEGRSEATQGIWSGKTPATTASHAEPEPEPAKTAPEPEAPKQTGKYIPPGQRAAAAAGARGGDSMDGPTIPSHIRRKMKHAPNITSEMDFPTLGGGGPGNRSSPESSGARFERVKHGGKYATEETSNRKASNLSLGNKFGALSGGND